MRTTDFPLEVTVDSRIRLFLVVLLLLVLTSGKGPLAQAEAMQEPSRPSLPQVPDVVGRNEPNDETSRVEREARKKANKERQAKLKRDTDQLLKLSTELKEYVDKTSENILSLDVIKKAAEIEKLAHSVKEKMRGYY